MTGARVAYALALLGAALFLIFYTGSFSLFLLLFLLVLPLCSFFLLLPAKKHLSCTVRQQSRAVRQGETAVFQLCVRSTSRIPTGQLILRYTCRNTLTSEHFRQKLRFPVSAGENIIQIPVTSPYCGKLELTIEKAAVCDLFGLFDRNCAIPQKMLYALVLPNLPNLQISAASAADAAWDSAEYDPHHTGNDASEPFEIREYLPGDRLNSIHWKLSEKRGSLMVRQGSLPLPAGPDLLLELQEAPPEVCSCAAETVLALSHALLAGGQQHRLLWFGSGTLHTVAIVSETAAEEATAGLLSAEPQQAASALASRVSENGRQLLYITSGTEIPWHLLPESAFVFCCGQAAPPDAPCRCCGVTPSSLADTLDGLQL